MRFSRIWVLIGSAVVVLSLGVLAVLAVIAGGTQAGAAGFGGGNRIAIIHLSGSIQDTGSANLLTGTAAITPRRVRSELERAQRDGSIRAVVLRINSPGGTVAASQEIASIVRRFEKPIVVSMGDQATSGGYYISAYADRIVAQPGTLTGSIGVIWAVFDVSGLLDKLGVEIDAVTSGEHKDMLLPGRLTDERRAIVQRMSDQMYQQFIEAVAEGRDLDKGDVRELATGEVYTGQQALELGLVDKLGGRQTALEEAAEQAGISEYTTVVQAPSLFEVLFQQGIKTTAAVRATLLGKEWAMLRQILTPLSVPRY